MGLVLPAADSAAKPASTRRGAFTRASATGATTIWATTWALAAAIAIAPISSGHAQSSSQDPVVAKVDGTEIHQSDFALADEYVGRDMRGWDEKAKHDALIAFLSDMVILSRAAIKEKVGDEKELQRRADFVRNKALMDKLLETTARSVTEESARKVYDDAVAHVPAQTETRFSTIFFKVTDPTDEAAVKAAEERAKAAYERIGKGEDFAELAKELSDHPSKQNGGDVGYLTQPEMGTEFTEAASKLEIGGVSAPFKSQAGWHLIKIEERRPRKPVAFELVRDKFVELATRRAQMQLVAKLRSEAKIERFDTAAQPAQPTDTSKSKE
jgi:peptidyl-prolyl cis-trans isomerase C